MTSPLYFNQQPFEISISNPYTPHTTCISQEEKIPTECPEIMTVWTHHPYFETQPCNFLWTNPFATVPAAKNGCPQDWPKNAHWYLQILLKKKFQPLLPFSPAQNTRQCKRDTDCSYLPPFLTYFLHPLLISGLLKNIAGNFSQEYFQFCPKTSQRN